MSKAATPLIDWNRLSWRMLIGTLVLLMVLNLVAVGAKVAQVAHLGLAEAVNTRGSDFLLMSQAAKTTVAGGNPYAGTAFMWTPLGALAFLPITLIGWHLWQMAHVGAALAMPSWRLRILVLLAFPFWYDVELGNILVFVLLAAVWALRGRSAGIGAFLILTVLVPRPLMAPIALWLVWRYPRWRLPFAALVIGAIAAAAVLGLLGPFVARSLEAGSVLHHGYNFAPSRVIGAWWLVIGLPLAAWLAWKGRLGLASLCASPYLLPYYLLLGLVDTDVASGTVWSAPWRRVAWLCRGA